MPLASKAMKALFLFRSFVAFSSIFKYANSKIFLYAELLLIDKYYRTDQLYLVVQATDNISFSPFPLAPTAF